MPSPEHIFHRPRVALAPDNKTGGLQNEQTVSENQGQKPNTPQINFRQLKDGDAEQLMKQLDEYGSRFKKEIKQRQENLGKGIKKQLHRRIEKTLGKFDSSDNKLDDSNSDDFGSEQ